MPKIETQEARKKLRQIHVVPANTKTGKITIARKTEAPFMWRTPAAGKSPRPLPTSQPIQRRSIKGFWVTDHLPLP